MSEDPATSTCLFLDAKSKLRLAAWLHGISRIPGLNLGRLGMLQLAGSDYVTLRELAVISNFMPEPLSNIIMDTEYVVREVSMP